MTPEQSALLSKAYDSVRAAKLLSDARLYDFAVSRAYYAMFYVAEAFLLGIGLSFSRHAGVIAAFGERFAKTGIVPVELHRYLIFDATQPFLDCGNIHQVTEKRTPPPAEVLADCLIKFIPSLKAFAYMKRLVTFPPFSLYPDQAKTPVGIA